MAEASQLGSLGQAARGKQLKSARWLMIVVGLLSTGMNGFLLANAKASIDKEASQLKAQGEQLDENALKNIVLQNQMIFGAGVLIGLAFIVLGALVYQFPVPSTVLGLVLYIGSVVVFAVLSPESLARGIIVKICIVVALAKSVSSALAYQKEAAGSN